MGFQRKFKIAERFGAQNLFLIQSEIPVCNVLEQTLINEKVPDSQGQASI